MSQVVLLRTNAVHYLLEKSSHQWFRVTKTFLQRICATSMCDSIPLLYTEEILFPSIFMQWYLMMVPFVIQFPVIYLLEFIELVDFIIYVIM